MKKIMTLGIIQQQKKILLGMKKRGFGMGRWNGFGGKVNEGETIEGALKREMLEECSIVPEDIVKLGVLNFSWNNKDDVCEVHIFKINNFSGIPTESEEMRPEWFEQSQIPIDKMWADGRHWLPLVLQGKQITAQFTFAEDNETIREFEIKNHN